MNEKTSSASPRNWLKGYYYTRGLVSAAWVAAAFALSANPAVAAFLLVAYPLWDAAANFADARRSGGLASNVVQTVNVVVSAAVAVAVAVTIGYGMNAVFAVFGIWAGLAGILQLLVGIRRWKTFGAQWAMVLSGLQSALAGGFFIKQSFDVAVTGIGAIAGYAGFGAFYFLLSAVLLTFTRPRQAR